MANAFSVGDISGGVESIPLGYISARRFHPSMPWHGATGLPAGFLCFRSQLLWLLLRRCLRQRGGARPWRGSTDGSSPL